MTLNSSEKFNSPYYPRRARWYARIFYLGLAVRHRLALDRIRLPNEITVGGLAGGILIPGLAVYLRGPRLYGQAALAACTSLFLCSLVWLGYPSGNYVFGLLLSIHVCGLVYYCSPWLANETFGSRILFTIGVMLGLGLLLYMPLRTHWLLPLRVNGHTVIVEKFSPARDIKCGDRVAYKLSGYFFSNHMGHGVLNQTSLGLGLVLATTGDRVEFSTNQFIVNGVPHLLLPHMPETGNWVVPEKHWFIWPNVAISGNWNVGEASISSAMMQMADVPEKQFAGKPFKRWFWRKEILP